MSSFTAFGSLANRVTALENEVGPSGSDIGYIVKVSNDLPANEALARAIDNYIGVLVGVETETELVLGTELPVEDRVDGQMLRFFNNGVNTDPATNFPYDVVEETAGTTLFSILPQEAYTMIWRVTQNDWVVVPGIINARSDPGVLQQ
jgi:hypothetical protein